MLSLCSIEGLLISLVMVYFGMLILLFGTDTWSHIAGYYNVVRYKKTSKMYYNWNKKANIFFFYLFYIWHWHKITIFNFIFQFKYH